MCIFTGNIGRVSGTQIFARIDGSQQWLAYEMKVEAAQPLAMVLPLPVTVGAGEDAVRFVDVSGIADLFERLGGLFPAPLGVQSFGGPVERAANLAVHEVGSFVASYVPSIGDFERLDARFRLESGVWQAMPQYADHGFAVFQLAAGNKKLHPMALSFPTRHVSKLYFPCMHVHDGEVHERAAFDHMLFAQNGSQDVGLPWEGSIWPPDDATVMESRGLLAAETVHRLSLSGEHRNADVFL